MQQRFHYIDDLRGLALLLGVVFHAALAYGPYFHNMWLSVDANKHVLFDYLAMWTHLFRMPLFFVIAGFCAAILVTKRGNGHFIRNRSKRVLLPFVIFLPLTLLVLFQLMVWGVEFSDHPPPLVNLLMAVKEPQINTMHLWFLWYLMQFCALFWLLNKNQRLISKLLEVVVKPVFIVVALPVVISAGMAHLVVPFPAPHTLQPQLWAYCTYGLLFMLGASLYHHHNIVLAALRYFKPLVLVACLTVGAYFYLLPEAPSLEQVRIAVNTGETRVAHINLLLVVVQTLAILSCTAVAYLAGYRWLNQYNEYSRYISDASYWIYLMHIPVLMCVQIPLSNTLLPALAKFTISLSTTLLIGFISYHFGVRYTVLGMLLNGTKATPMQSKAMDSPR
tara:strand:+ start:7677 stop:8849 length:1173 start_codon:yes stop_codon:yes gene_type:complete